MELKEFFDKLFKRNSDKDDYLNHLIDNSDYAAFKAWEAITYQEVENYFKDNDPIFYSRFRREVHLILRVTLGASLLIMAQNKAYTMKRTSEIAKTIPEKELIYEEAKKILLDSFRQFPDDEYTE